jgi:hypothetical protein
MSLNIIIRSAGLYQKLSSLEEILRWVGGPGAEVYFDGSQVTERVNKILCDYNNDLLVQNGLFNGTGDKTIEFLIPANKPTSLWVIIYIIYWDEIGRTWRSVLTNTWYDKLL